MTIASNRRGDPAQNTRLLFQKMNPVSYLETNLAVQDHWCESTEFGSWRTFIAGATIKEVFEDDTGRVFFVRDAGPDALTRDITYRVDEEPFLQRLFFEQFKQQQKMKGHNK